MFLATVVITLNVAHSGSLKEKRMVLRKIKDKFFSKFKVILYEVGYLDLHQSSKLAFAVISTDKKTLESMTDIMINYLYDNCGCDIADVTKEIEKK